MRYSSGGQDDYILEIIGDNGYYVDVGAAGLNGSNTYQLELKGWSGLCIEPNPIHILTITHNRNCTLDKSVIWSEEKEVTFVQHNHDKYVGNTGHADHGGSYIFECRSNHPDSGDYSKITKKSDTLSNVLKKHKAPQTIDFLDIDIEGAGYDVIRTFDFNEYFVKILIIEHEKNTDNIKKEMNNNNFEYIKDIHYDMVFLNKKYKKR